MSSSVGSPCGFTTALCLITPTGNDHDEDSDKEPEPPVKVVDKPIGRSSKRNNPDVAPGGLSERNATGADRDGHGGRRGGFTGSEDGMSTSALTFPILQYERSRVKELGAKHFI